MLSKKSASRLLHVAFIILGTVIPLWLLPYKDKGNPDFFDLQRVIFTVLEILAFHFNAHFLYPRLLIRQRPTAYIITVLSVCSLLSLGSSLSYLVSGTPMPYPVPAYLLIKFFITLLVMSTATCYRFIIDVMRQQHLQHEHLKMELSFLRSQVSPHFMFNTLNSMVALARKKSDKLEPALMELSNLMHYMLYESDEEKVSLVKEIDYLQSYIDLQTLRFGHQVQILFLAQKPGNELCIEPMLLIPLIENAFKHGIGLVEQPEISISLDSDEQGLQLSVSNKIATGSVDTKDKVQGIGLSNLRRRLKILYPGKHELHTRTDNGWFHASLKITLYDTVHRC